MKTGGPEVVLSPLLLPLLLAVAPWFELLMVSRLFMLHSSCWPSWCIEFVFVVVIVSGETEVGVQLEFGGDDEGSG